MWRGVSLTVTLALLAFGTSGGRISAAISAAYPSDSAARAALARCSINDSKFSRFYESDRQACYMANHVVVALDPPKTIPPELNDAYAAAYPQDPLERQALDLCYQADQRFNRLNPDERAACYARALPAAPPALASAPHSPVNFVDLRQAQGRGRQPPGDVRSAQQNGETMRLIRATRY
jgi:hypothetical protein